VIEKRFHRELYEASSVDDAVTTFADYATLERADDATHLVVRIAAADAARERKIAAELANFALGLTIRKGGTLGASA